MSKSIPAVRFRSKLLPLTCATLTNWDFQGLLASEGHYRLPNGRWSGGGPFYVHNESMTHSGPYTWTLEQGSGPTTTIFAGCAGVTATPPVVNQSMITRALDDAAGYALRGFNRTKPGRPLVDLFVSGKEIITDGLPGIPFRDVLFGKKKTFLGLPRGTPLHELPGRLKDKLKDLSGLGSEYLNAVFGWKPLVNDIRKLYRAMKNVDATIAKLASQNGQNIRRRVVLRDDTSVTVTRASEHDNPFQDVYCNPPTPFITWQNGGSKVTVAASTQTKVWYSACFRYWIPDIVEWQFSGRAKRALFGVNPTPGAIWAAMPWTWLVDWFSDLGEIADALSPTAVDGLTMRYGYTMMHDYLNEEACSVTDLNGANTLTKLGNQTLGYKFESFKQSCRSVHIKERKIRTGGVQPFGPGVSLGDITPSRAAILAALGLSRGNLTF